MLYLVFLPVLITATLNITSPAFQSRARIPVKYTCDGDNISPPINVGELPKGTQSLVLIVEDPDAPKGTFDHWVMFNIKPMKDIPEGTDPGTQGKNGAGDNKYTGPCPPSGSHHYYFKVYALDAMLELKEGATKSEVMQAMSGHILGKGELVGMYNRQ